MFFSVTLASRLLPLSDKYNRRKKKKKSFSSSFGVVVSKLNILLIYRSVVLIKMEWILFLNKEQRRKKENDRTILVFANENRKRMNDCYFWPKEKDE
jgi:hypothetical protein